LYIILFSSATYQKLGKDKEAYEDALKALALIKEKPSVDVSVEAKAQLRKGYAFAILTTLLPHSCHTNYHTIYQSICHFRNNDS
jgi:hypothetical protein